MTTSVTDLRLSFIWTEFHDRLLQEPAPAAPFSFLGRQPLYAKRFSSVQHYDDSDPDGLIPPWPRHRGKHFWSMYLDRDPHDVDPWRAWKCFVPLRVRPASHLTPAAFPGTVNAEGFFYPHGFALLVDVRLRPTATDLAQVADLAHEVYSGISFPLSLLGDSLTEMKLDSLAAALRAFLREKAYGPAAISPTAQPYSVATFVQVTGVDATKPIEEKGEIHRVLEAVTRWPTPWQIAPLPDLATAVIADPDLPDAHVLYCRRRGRATWFPGLATPTFGKNRKLGCYHRNQSLAALQIASMGGLITGTVARLKSGATLSLSQEQCARNAANLLGRLYGGMGTYRSRVCRNHLEQDEIADDLAELRDHFGMTPLHAPAA